ncbi:MAG: alpha/beta hydrolase [Sandaracinaceae bacterium]|nr:alpha/beta hydrolase [Sandaracinaceae bacterium]
MDTSLWLGQGPRVDRPSALRTRTGLSYLATRAGSLRVRHAPSEGPKLLFAADGPNVIEHYDALIAALDGRADVVVLEPPGTGASAPARGFDFTLESFTEALLDALGALGPRTLILPCYLGVVAQQVALRNAKLAPRVVMPQTPSWADFARWADLVDRGRLVRTPVVGQCVMSAGRRRVAAQWYRASTSSGEHARRFTETVGEAFAFGGCFCLASTMQGFERGPAPEPRALPVPAAVVWGRKDRTHRRSDPMTSVPGAEVVFFDECGHSPELEDPQRFARWLLTWSETHG